MGEAASILTLDYASYLSAEAASPTKHEWVDGHVYAMAGGTLAHGELAVAVASELRAMLGAGPCRVYSSDVRVRVLASGLATYPDVSVACHPETDPSDPHALTNPVVVVEVLSDSTELWDRSRKFAHYRKIPSLRDYVLVSQHEPHIEVYSLRDGQWALSEAEGGGRVALTAIDGAIDVDRVYAGIALSPPPPPPTEP